MSERVVRANGLEIWTETFGASPHEPTALLIMGATMQAIRWPDEFCQDLASAGFRVIRYDHRDTGQSTCFDFSVNPYTIDDQVADALVVLGAYEVASAHIVGVSMGGAIAWRLAIDHPDRVSTLTLIMASAPPGSAPAPQEGSREWKHQQRMHEAAGLCGAPAPNEEERIERWVQLGRVFAGPDQPFDEQAARERQRKMFARARNFDASWNHLLQGSGRERRIEDLKGIEAPTLVIHGTGDPSFSEGKVLANAIPGARFLPIDGMGHYFGPPVPPEVLPAMIEHMQ